MTKARDLANAADVLDDVSATELSYVNGVTSSIQTQLNAKQAVVSGVNDTEIGYLDGVSSAIQTQLDGKTAKSTLTTTGDIYYASSANTPARLGIGSTGNVLTVASGIPSWAAPAAGGGMTLLSTTNLTGASVTVSTIDQTYNNLYLLIENAYPAADTYLHMTANSDTTTANYQASLIGLRNSTMAFRPDNLALHAYGMDSGTARNNLIAVTLFNYAGSTYKSWSSYASIYGDSTSPFFINSFGNTIWYDSAAINSLTFSMNASTFSAGTVKIYGVK